MIGIPLGMMVGALALAGLPRPLPRLAQLGLAVVFAAGLLGVLGLLFAGTELDSVLAQAAAAAQGHAAWLTAILVGLGIVLCILGASRAVDEVLNQEHDGPLRNPGPPAVAALAGLLILIAVVQQRL